MARPAAGFRRPGAARSPDEPDQRSWRDQPRVSGVPVRRGRRMKDFDEALALVLDGLPPLEAEQVPLTAAVGRVLAGEARAVIDLPPFDRTAMDGYAVRAEDVSP